MTVAGTPGPASTSAAENGTARRCGENVHAMFDTEYEKSWHAREYPVRQSNNAACDAFPVDHDRHVSGSAARVSSDSMSPSADRWREPNRTAVPGFHLQYQDQTCAT